MVKILMHLHFVLKNTASYQLLTVFLKVCKRTECFKLKLNVYLAFKITFDTERLPLLPIQFAKF
jgi:UDP-glucose 6-dehydrogenase